MADFGYDVADYCDIDPLFGTLADFDRLLADAHARGLRVLLDWVPNHTSSQHPWFQSSRSSRHSPHREWYVWRDRPNNWRSVFGDGATWAFDERTEQWYLHLFLPDQPDLNWRNPDVVAAMHETLRFWLDRGVDGFRADVVHMIAKDCEYADDPPELAGVPKLVTNADEHGHALLRDIRRLLGSYVGDRMMVGEVNLPTAAHVVRYYGASDELHLAFNFAPMFTAWDAAAWRQQIDLTFHHLDAVGAWPTWVLSNHDQVRHRTRYGSESRARAAAVLLLTLRGTPFLYAGEELGLEEAVLPPDRVVDPAGRDGCRAPIPWNGFPHHGWGNVQPWLPWPPEPERRNVAELRGDEASILHLYCRLLASRRGSAARRLVSWVTVITSAGTLAYLRVLGHDRRAVLVNFTRKAIGAPVADRWLVEVASDGFGEGYPYEGRLGPDQAVILRPEGTQPNLSASG